MPPENSLLFVQALRKAGVDLELHLYEGGRHGFGLGEKEGPIGTWPVMGGLWLHKHGFAKETTVSIR